MDKPGSNKYSILQDLIYHNFQIALQQFNSFQETLPCSGKKHQAILQADLQASFLWLLPSVDLSPLGDILGGKLGMFLHNLSGDFSLLRSGEE